MMRIFNLLTIVVVFVAGFALYHMKFETQQLEDHADALNRQMMSDKAEIKVLNAEWAYLSSPPRLEELTARYLALKPASPKQMLITVANIDPRPGSENTGMQVDQFDVAWAVGRHVAPHVGAIKVADNHKVLTNQQAANQQAANQLVTNQLAPNMKLAEASRHAPFNPATDKLRLISTDLGSSNGERP
jgi:hypothetical protein